MNNNETPSDAKYDFRGQPQQEYNFFSKSKNNQQTEPTYSVYVATSEFKTQPIMAGG